MELYAAGALIGAPLLVLANNWLKKRGGWRCRRAARVNWSDEGDDVFGRIRAHTCSSKCPPDCDAWAYMVDPDEGSGGGGEASSELLSRLRRKHRGELDVDDSLEDADTVDTMDGEVHVTRSVQRRASLRRHATGRHSRNDSTASDFSDGFEFAGGAKEDRRSDDECEAEEEEECEERHEEQEQHRDADGQYDAGYEQQDAEDEDQDDNSSQQHDSSQSSAGKSRDANSHRYSLRKHLRRSWTHSDLQGNQEQRIHRKKSPYKI